MVRIDDGTSTAGVAVLIATGARYRKLAVPRLEKFEGVGVYYAATSIEARVCVGGPVIVVGGGNSAGQAALFLAGHAENVTLVIRSDLGTDMSRYLVDQLERHPHVEILDHTEVREVIGDDVLQGVVVENNQTGARRTLHARAIFVFIGAKPHVGWLGDQVALDEHGFVLTGEAAARADADGDASPRPTSLPARDQSARGVRRRRRSQRVYQAGGRGRGRGIHGRTPRA